MVANINATFRFRKFIFEIFRQAKIVLFFKNTKSRRESDHIGNVIKLVGIIEITSCVEGVRPRAVYKTRIRIVLFRSRRCYVVAEAGGIQ
ncbi:hypothetical protein DF182_25660 [Chitinophaga flava]|uniref:Uncharacterized protein n=1 Tax=Chitinophaga flava TaxID=2259036 RepID=A0A365XU39_9BACT|nr:hypothetical protein DF182_25660 [Chitinophaga flava]